MKQINYTWEQFDEDCKKIIEWIRENNFKFTGIYGIQRGGLILAVKLSHLLHIPLILNRTSIYSKTLIVDDIADTGKTLKNLMGGVRTKKNIVITLWYHKQSKFKPNFTLREKKKAWIVYPWEK